MATPPIPRVRRPVMHQHWRCLTFLHWRYPPEVVQAVLPDDLAVETADGAAWVGLVPFLMDGVRAPGLPAVPWLSRFPETNVRTYVRAPDGTTGIWFLSLDAARLPAVLTARATYGLPYFWSSMSVRRDGDRVRYASRRRFPGPPGASCDVAVRFAQPWEPSRLTGLDHFLTARFRLYSVVAGRLVAAEAEHPMWRLRRAELEGVREDLLAAAGLPRPDHAPLVHAAEGTRVRIGRWRWV